MSELIGRVIDHYRLEAMLGDGGMGTVYRAYDLNLERPVALKIMHPHYARRPQFRARLRQEAKTLASLDHPSIVRVLDFGEEGELAYLAMEYISGGSLRAHLQRLQQRRQTLPLDQCLQIGLQIAEALQYAHERGLIHRDVKPSNVILKRLSRADEPGEQPFRAVLTDFGLVKLLQGDNLTESGTTLGTPAYMSPEQCEGLDLDGRSDLYSLGVVLYELLTNKLPFQFGSLAEAIATHMRGEMPSSPREVRPDVPSVVEAIVTRALAKDPDDRFESAEAMATDLRSALYSLSDRPTRVLPQVDREQLAADAVDDVPQGYQLLIETPGYETTEVALNRSVLSLGRDADNDVVLPAEGVSRHHARLQATAAGWAIVDLGGVNGTQLNGERIEVNRPVRVRRDDVLQIGPYGLSLQGPEEEVEGAGTPVSERSTPPPQVTTRGDEEAAPLALFLTRDRVAVQPGKQADFNLEIVNRSQVDDRVTVVVEGLPDGWVEAPDEFISVPAGQSTPVTITIRPPRQTEIPAGRQRFRLRLRSQQHAQDEPSVTASLMLGALEAFEAGLTPQRLELPGTIQVSLRNTGNAPATFSVVGHDPEQKLRFHGEQGRVRLEPQQSAVVEMELEPRRQGWFASTDAYPFAVEVRNRAGSHQMLSGEADIGSMVPTWLSYAALMVVVFICVFSFLFLAFGDQLGRPRGAAATEAAATTTAVAAAELQTIVAATATIDAATRLAITPTSVVDADNDGLSDEQEQVLGTAADNPDTDGDGLLDGPEVLEHGCDPLRRDTDNDFLNDWDEINVYGTQCNNPDTDGDGLSDGSEVTQGTDPLVPESATATITPTPSETAPVTPSTTPTPPDTPSPSPTGSPTASPTNTGTPTVTPTSTTTGTPTPLPTATQTPTITPTPNPAMACVSVSPTVDGNLGDQAWSGDPTLTITEPEYTILVYLARDSEALYAAFDVEDASMDDEDALRYYLDVNRNQGDPDEDDRYFEVARDGELTVYQGSGDNVDGLGWEETVGDGVVAAVSAPAEDRWLAELAISLADGLSAPLADPSGAMMEFVVEAGLLFGEQSVIWPEEASPTNAGTWSVVESPACP